MGMAAGSVLFHSDGVVLMILICLIGILLVAGILAWLTARWNAQLPRWISLIAIGVDLVLAAGIWAGRALKRRGGLAR